MKPTSQETKELLSKVDFINRYEKLYNAHNHKNYMEQFENTAIKQIISSFGYEQVRYFKKEDFFTIEEIEIEGKFDISFRLSVKYAIVEFLLAFGTEDGKISIGGPFGFICKLLGRDDIKKPRFSSYEELKEILQEGFAIYEDIKAELAKM